LRVLEVSLRKAGFVVTPALSVQDALDKLDLHAPDLIISETTFPESDGFELRRRVRATPEWSEIPFIFLTAEAAIENKIRGLELGVDDYLTKPIYIKEIVTRINILMQKRQRVRFEERRDGRTRFAGRVQDMPVVDVIQTIEISRKSGVIQFVGERGRQAAIYFRDGRVIDAEAGSLQGEDAVYRLLTWGEGEFEVVFRTVRRREVITMSSQGLLMEGMRRLDEWSRLFEQLPPLTHRFEVDTVELAARLGDVPDDNNRILRLFDGKRTLLEVIDASDVGDLECLQAISRLYFEELLVDLDHGRAPRRDTGKSIPLVAVETPTPMEEVASGPGSSEAAAGKPLEAKGGEAAETVAGAAPEAVAEDVPGAAPEPVVDGALTGEPTLPGGGPLMGGYRLSSLRLIDEAVAAAQAIEPSLFDDMADAPVREPAGAHGGNGVSGAAQAPVSRSGAERAHLAPAGGGTEGLLASAASPESSAAGREESGLRMIGSLGRDRAEASGELASLGQALPPRNETARELVTILPRRITREVPAVTQELAESLQASTPPPPVVAPNPAAAVAVESPPQTSPMTPSPMTSPPVASPPQPRVAAPGSGVRTPLRSSRFFRILRPVEGGGPGLGIKLLILLVAVLAGAAVVLRLRRSSEPPQRVESVVDAARPPDAPSAHGTAGPGPDAHDRPGEPPASSEPLVPPSDAAGHGAAPPVDARPPAAAGQPAMESASASAGVNRITEAKALYDQAHGALEEGAFARAFDLAESSLKLRKTARTYLLRAQAEQRLDRVDAALASVAAAALIAPEYGAVWELRGRILWAARRREEAREAFEKFLEIEPNSPKAAFIQRLINEPR
jgi:DNA-binding response OmpR family regulator